MAAAVMGEAVVEDSAEGAAVAELFAAAVDTVAGSAADITAAVLDTAGSDTAMV